MKNNITIKTSIQQQQRKLYFKNLEVFNIAANWGHNIKKYVL